MHADAFEHLMLSARVDTGWKPKQSSQTSRVRCAEEAGEPPLPALDLTSELPQGDHRPYYIVVLWLLVLSVLLFILLSVLLSIFLNYY